MKLRVQGISTAKVNYLKTKEDAYNNKPQIHIAEGVANPCRHCLQLITEGENKLVLSYMPFENHQPYAETGPIFLHESHCTHYDENTFPDWFTFLDPAIVRGYDDNDWIVYETGKIVSGNNIENECIKILEDGSIQYVHVRSKFNCFQCVVTRA